MIFELTRSLGNLSFAMSIQKAREVLMFLQLFRLPALGFCLLSTAFATELAKPSYSISDSEVSNLAFGSITVRAPRSAAETDVGFWAKATVATAGGVVTSYKIAELPYTVTRD